MGRSRHTEAQIIGALKQIEAFPTFPQLRRRDRFTELPVRTQGAGHQLSGQPLQVLARRELHEAPPSGPQFPSMRRDTEVGSVQRRQDETSALLTLRPSMRAACTPTVPDCGMC